MMAWPFNNSAASAFHLRGPGFWNLLSHSISSKNTFKYSKFSTALCADFQLMEFLCFGCNTHSPGKLVFEKINKLVQKVLCLECIGGWSEKYADEILLPPCVSLGTQIYWNSRVFSCNSKTIHIHIHSKARWEFVLHQISYRKKNFSCGAIEVQKMKIEPNFEKWYFLKCFS